MSIYIIGSEISKEVQIPSQTKYLGILEMYMLENVTVNYLSSQPSIISIVFFTLFPTTYVLGKPSRGGF